MSKRFMMFTVVFFTSLYHYCKSTNLPTYKHPTIPTQLCFKCPPGFRIEGVGIEAKKCPITPDGRPSFPNCIECPDGYYSEKWDTLHYCREQDRCTKPDEFLLYSGRQTQPNICGCKYGYLDDHNCKKETIAEEHSNVKKQPTVQSTLKLPNTAAATSIHQAEGSDETIYFVIVGVGCFVLGVLCFGILCKLKQAPYKGNRLDAKDEFSMAAKYVEENLPPYCLHRFLRIGLEFNPNEIQRIEMNAGAHTAKGIMLAIERWRHKKTTVTVKDLIAALEVSELQGIANKIKDLQDHTYCAVAGETAPLNEIAPTEYV